MLAVKQNKSPILLYPARLQSLVLIGFVCVFFYALLFASLLSYVLSQGASAPFYLLGIFVAYALINIVFEYGQEIISETFSGLDEVPVFSIHSIHHGRFFRQLLMTAFFGSSIFGLYQYNYNSAALALTAFLVLILPASVSVNALFEEFKDVIDPRTLIAYIAVTKTSYISSLLGIIFLIGVFLLGLELGFLAFSILLPFWLYFCLVFFRHLGLVAHVHRHELLPEKDFDADKKEIEQHFSDNAAIHGALEKAYWGLKEGRIDEAIDIVGPIIRIHDWARFEFVFEFISNWPTKVPAIQFTKEYLASLHAKRNSIRALELCGWCLKQDSDFCIEDCRIVDYLLAESVSKEQFIVLVKLLDNFASRFPEHENSQPYLFRAADICRDKLHHQEKFQELQDKLAGLQSS